MAVGSAHEIFGRSSDERSCDNAPDGIISLQNIPRDFAVFVKLFDGNDVFVCGNLKNAVGGRVNYERARFHMLLAVIFYNFRSRIRFVAKGFSARAPFEFFYNLVGETVGENRERFFGNYPRNLPMPYRRVLPCRLFDKPRIRAERLFLPFAEINSVDIEKPEFFHVRDIKFSRIETRFKRVAPLVAERRRVGRITRTETVQNDKKHSH